MPSARCRRSPPGEPGTGIGHWFHGHHGSSCEAITPGVIGPEVPFDPKIASPALEHQAASC